jgi:hypothetical protein
MGLNIKFFTALFDGFCIQLECLSRRQKKVNTYEFILKKTHRIKRCEIRSNGYGTGNQTLNGSGTVLEQKKRIFNGLEIENPFLDQLLLV